jgi:predicted ribosome quality control (RQC) complex YloA/Tae2 family protein
MVVLSSAEVSLLVKETAKEVTGSYVRNVYTQSPRTVILKLYRPGVGGGELWLVAGSAFFYTTASLRKPSNPSAKTLQLRRYLQNLMIQQIQQLGYERIVEISFAKNGYKLLAELMPPGNIILTSDNKILWVLEEAEKGGRIMKIGVDYTPPPPRYSLLPGMRIENVWGRLNPKSPLVSTLSRDLGIGGKYGEEIVYRSGVDKMKKVEDLTAEELERIRSAVESFLSEISNPSPRLYLKNGEAMPSLIELKTMEGFNSRIFEKFTESVVNAYVYEAELSEAKAAEEEYKKVIEQLRKDLSEKQYTLLRLEKSRKDMEELISRIRENISIIDGFWEDVDGNMRMLREVFGEGVKHEHGLLVLSVESASAEFRRGISAHRQLGKLFDELKSIKHALQRLRDETDKLVKEIAEAEAKLAPVQRPFTAVKTKASQQPQPFRKFTTSGGFNVLLGKDAKSNIALLKKHLEKNDVVLHADLPGSPATVVKMGLKASQQDLEEAAQMTACYSRAWREGFTNCTVYYVSADQVSFTPPSGQYLPKGSFMVYGRKTYLTSELRLAAYFDQDINAQITPVLTALRTGVNHVELRPGNTKAQEASRFIADLLEVKPSEEQLWYLAKEIPYGRCSIYLRNKLIRS